MEQVLNAPHPRDSAHALLDIRDFTEAADFAAQDDRALLAVDVHVALAHLSVTEQLALDPVAGLMVDCLSCVRCEVPDAVRDPIRLGGHPTPHMPDASAEASCSRHKPIAQHVASPPPPLAIEEIHHQGTDDARTQAHPHGTY